MNKNSKRNNSKGNSITTKSSSTSNSTYFYITAFIVVILGFLISPQVNDSISPLNNNDDVDLPQTVWLTLIRAGYENDINGTLYEKRFMNRTTFIDWTFKKKGRFFNPLNGIEIKTWKQMIHWISRSENENNNNNNNEDNNNNDHLLGEPRSPYIYFDPGMIRKGNEDDIEVRDGDGGIPFVWPPLHIGHKVIRKDIKPPCGKDYPITVETLNDSPKIFYVSNFMSIEETETLVEFSQSPDNPYSLRPSTTGHKSWTEGGQKNTNSQRTSLNGFDISSPTSMAIKKRGFDLLKISPYSDGMSDGIQVLRYEKTQAYIPHSDYFKYKTSPDHNWDPRIGGTNRFATILLFLSDVAEGGETVFPKVTRLNSMPTYDLNEVDSIEFLNQYKIENNSWEHTMVKQCREHFSVKPKRGDALLFYSQLPDGTLDERSLHGGCPVLSGEKWAANVWVWNGCRYNVCKNLPP